jgi:hypothetical protein
MRLPTLAVLAQLVSLSAADFLIVNVVCTTSSCSYLDGKWTTDYGTNYVNGADGCQDPPYIPGMNTLCLDWKQARGHFFFDNQSKRCLHLDGYSQPSFCPPNQTCYQYYWNEVACTWR